jgi:NADPH:quinone reductase-like Zn-dependent oxidoreductase
VTSPQATAVVVRTHGGPDRLVVEQVPMPVPGPGQVLVEVEAAGVAYADVLMRRGVYPETPQLPFTPGYDVVGRVRAVGPDVQTLAVGDRVAALTVTGGYASHTLATADLAVGVPDDLPADRITALVLNYVTAYQLLHRIAKVPPGGSILVHGAAGGVGTALLELAAAHGVQAWGSASGDRTAAVTARGGVAIDRTRHDVATQVRGALPEGVTATFDAVGGRHLHLSRHATQRRGSVVSYGISFAVDEQLSRRVALRRHVGSLARISLTPGPRARLYVIAGRRGFATRRPHSFREDLGTLVGLLRRGQLDPETRCLPVTDASRAHTLLEQGAVTGKLVLTGPGAT